MKNILSKKILRYILAGGSTFLLEYMSYLVLLYTLKVPLVLSITLGYVIALTYNFLMNKMWVFSANKHSKSLNTQMVLYLLLLGFNYIVNVSATYYLTVYLLVPAYISRLLVMILIVCWNFIIYNKLIFTRNDYEKELDAKEKS